MGTAGAEQYLMHLLARAVELRPDAPAGEFDGLMRAANVTVTAYSAAGVFSRDEARRWRDRIADAVMDERARAKGT